MKRLVLLSLACAVACAASAADEVCGAPRVQARSEIIWPKALCK